MQWKSICQEGIDGLWKELCDIMQEDILEKCKVDETKKRCLQGARRSSNVAGHREAKGVSSSKERIVLPEFLMAQRV